MPTLTLLSPAELEEQALPVRARKRREREQGIERYAEWLRGASLGFGGEIELAEDESKAAERVLLKEAAKRLGLNLNFRPLKNQQLIAFTVVENPVRRGPPPSTRGKRRTKTA